MPTKPEKDEAPIRPRLRSQKAPASSPGSVTVKRQQVQVRVLREVDGNIERRQASEETVELVCKGPPVDGLKVRVELH